MITPLFLCNEVTGEKSFLVTDLTTRVVMFSERISFARQIQTFRFTASELSRVGDVIGQVRAVDVDKDNQAEVFYQIASGNQKGMRQISYLRIYIPTFDLL